MPQAAGIFRASFAAIAIAAVLPAYAESAAGGAPTPPSPVVHILEAYPDALAAIDGNTLVWRDGTRMPLDDGKKNKPFAEWLAEPDIEDMLRQPYPAGAGPLVPPRESDPGRARNAAFFTKMYGDCRKGEVKPKLEAVAWLPSRTRQTLEVTTVNGVAARLAAVSKELDALPASFNRYLIPAAGTYNCRVIAGTDRTSAHGFGIAIDIAIRESDYWRWTAKGAAGVGPDGAPLPYRNRIPLEIVRIFERQGFIWGGRWLHFDTMHFEYRPELLPALAPLDRPAASGTPAAR